jgi:glycosyltransferase involved in cell wall biosynthesis
MSVPVALDVLDLAVELRGFALDSTTAAPFHVAARVSVPAGPSGKAVTSGTVTPSGSVTPSCSDTASACRGQPDGNTIVFHGNMSYAPNVDAVRFLCRDVLPRLRDTHPTLVLSIVGYDPAPAIRALHDGTRVIVTAGVADIVPYLTAATLGVYPLRFGSGMPNKVLDALACGLACIVSPLAAAGIERARAFA